MAVRRLQHEVVYGKRTVDWTQSEFYKNCTKCKIVIKNSLQVNLDSTKIWNIRKRITRSRKALWIVQKITKSVAKNLFLSLEYKKTFWSRREGIFYYCYFGTRIVGEVSHMLTDGFVRSSNFYNSSYCTINRHSAKVWHAHNSSLNLCLWHFSFEVFMA